MLYVTMLEVLVKRSVVFIKCLGPFFVNVGSKKEKFCVVGA